MDRRAEVNSGLEETGTPLDGDEIAKRLGMNRLYVNQVCRRLAVEGAIRRSPGGRGKVVNVVCERAFEQRTPLRSSRRRHR
jgi:DNA-binding GntR family transcriptional regulator